MSPLTLQRYGRRWSAPETQPRLMSVKPINLNVLRLETDGDISLDLSDIRHPVKTSHQNIERVLCAVLKLSGIRIGQNRILWVVQPRVCRACDYLQQLFLHSDILDDDASL
jgi:hypothetical protein